VKKEEVFGFENQKVHNVRLEVRIFGGKPTAV
jgi:hypothetical protein